MITLRPYQERDIGLIRAAFKDGAKRVLYVLPTGGGKTVEFCYIIKGAASKSNRSVVLAHRKELIRQCSRALRGFEVPHGIIMPGNTMTRDMIQVASVQALVKRLQQVDDFDFGVADEAHHATAGSWSKIFNAWGECKWLGVTATPERLDGTGLGEVFDVIIIGPSIRELIDDGYLCQPLVYAPPVQLDFNDLAMRAGDFAPEAIAAKMDRPTITGDAVEHYKRLCPGQPAIAFCASVDHAEHVAEQFCKAGFRARSLDGKVSDNYRDETITGLGDGRFDVVTSCEIISEGTDIPVVAAGINLRPTQSLTLCLQQAGRVLRPIYAPGFDLSTRQGRLAAIAASDKPRALILDHVGNSMRHGLPDEDRVWSLNGKKRTAKSIKKALEDIKIKQCKNCYAVHKPAPKCPHCGYVYVTDGRSIREVKGQLVAITHSASEYSRINKMLRAATKNYKSVNEFKQVAEENGYKPNWAYIQFKSQNEEIMRLKRQLDEHANMPILPLLGGAENAESAAGEGDSMVQAEG